MAGHSGLAHSFGEGKRYLIEKTHEQGGLWDILWFVMDEPLC